MIWKRNNQGVQNVQLVTNWTNLEIGFLNFFFIVNHLEVAFAYGDIFSLRNSNENYYSEMPSFKFQINALAVCDEYTTDISYKLALILGILAHK